MVTAQFRDFCLCLVSGRPHARRLWMTLTGASLIIPAMNVISVSIPQH
jgi:hypothetical protein